MKYDSVKRMPRSRASSRSRHRLQDEATLVERTLMVALKAAGEPFAFQYVVRTSESLAGFYVVDFKLPRRKLFVELDGKPHTSEQAKWNDRLRTEAIERAWPDYLVVRFWNREVEKDAAAVVKRLQTT